MLCCPWVFHGVFSVPFLVPRVSCEECSINHIHIISHKKTHETTTAQQTPQTRLKMFTCSFRVKRLRLGLLWHWDLCIYRSSACSLQPGLCFLCQGPTLILNPPFLHNDGLYHGGNGASHVRSSHKRLYFPVPGYSSGTASRPIFFCYFVHHKRRQIWCSQAKWGSRRNRQLGVS